MSREKLYLRLVSKQGNSAIFLNLNEIVFRLSE